MLDSDHIGSRFRVEILPQCKINLYCDNDHKEECISVDKVSTSWDELHIAIGQVVHKFTFLFGFWIYAGYEE